MTLVAALLLQGCASTTGNPGVRTNIPGPPEYLKPVEVDCAKDKRPWPVIAKCEREGRKAANTIISAEIEDRRKLKQTFGGGK